MDVKDLKYFVAVYEAKNFSRATSTLDTVQSNVSLRIRNLEDFLDVKLFERHHRAIAPTDKGVRLYMYAKQVLALMELTEREIRPRSAA